MLYYVEIADDFTVIQQHDLAAPQLEVADPSWRLISSPIDWTGRPNTSSILVWPPDDTAPSWADPRTLAQARTDKSAEMSQACASAILAGFISSALGAAHHYPAKLTDQSNLAGSIIDSLIPCPPDWVTPFWCCDAAGDWQFRMHTATQIQQVGRDGKAAILAAMTRNEVLRGQIAEATMAELDSMRWAA